MDKEKIDEIYRENAAMIYKYLCGLTQDRGLAEELTQKTFFQAVKGMTDLGEIVKFLSAYAELQKNYGIRNWKREAGIKPPH